MLAAPVLSAYSLPQKAQAAAGETALLQDRTSTVPANIAPTVATSAHANVQVFDTPRMTRGHPNTIWDQEDIAHYKEMLKTSRELQIQFSELKGRMDERIDQPIDIPPPQKGADGSWLYPGDYFPPLPGLPGDAADPRKNFAHHLMRDAEAISGLGMLYALTGEEKYAKYARDLLLAYSNCSHYGTREGMDYRYGQGLSDQFLGEALDLQQWARGYDLIYNSPSLSSEDRIRIHDELIFPFASEFLFPQTPESDQTNSFSRGIQNRGAIGSVSVLLAGYATDDPELVDAALYGIRTDLTRPDTALRKQFPPPKVWVAATSDRPSNGLLTVHFAPPGISGGMWVEGTPSYSFYALNAMVSAAEAGWHHGLDLYRYNDCILKYMFDYPFLLNYPDMTSPGENDSPRGSKESEGGYTPTLYEYGYRRYRDRRYLTIINSPGERAFLAARTADPHSKEKSQRYLSNPVFPFTPPSLLYDLDPREAPPPTMLRDANFPSVGYGILRTRAAGGAGIQNLTLSYGPSASHGHPDKLHIDLYSFGDVLMPSPGVQFPYNNPLDGNWFHTTLAHNTLTVDEKSQNYHQHLPKVPDVRADQTVYGPAETVGVERAWTDSAYPGVTMDRAVFLTDEYLADLFGAFSDSPHKYDLAWHIRGTLSSKMAFMASPFRDPVPNGYSALADVRQAQPTSDSWSVNLAIGGHAARLVVAGGTATQPVVGDGFYVDRTSSAPQRMPAAPTILERRENNQSTIFGNVLDLSGGGDAYVKRVSQEGGADSGYALLRVETADGVDLCFASYRPGRQAAGGLETDALQALVQTDGSAPRTLYLGGGTLLKIGDAALERSEEGLAYVEKAADDGYIVGNPSPTAATVTVKLAALHGLAAFDLDDEGKARGSANANVAASGEVSIWLKAGAKVEFLSRGKPGQESLSR